MEGDDTSISPIIPPMKPEEKHGHSDQSESLMIAYQSRQLPQLPVFPVQKWRLLFPEPTTLPVPTFDRRDNRPGGGHGTDDGLPVTEVLAWKIDEDATRNNAFVTYTEFGYDGDGYLTRLRKDSMFPVNGEIKEYLRNPDSTPTLDDKPHQRVTQRCGREWVFGLSGICDDSLLSIAALQLCRDVNLIGGSECPALDEGRRRMARGFVTKFRARWDVELSRELWGTSDYTWVRSPKFDGSCWDDLVFQYHMRVFSTNLKSRPLGRGLQRSSGKLQEPDTGGPRPAVRRAPSRLRTPHTNNSGGGGSSILPVIELRYSVALKTTWRWDDAAFTLVTMADSTGGRLKSLAEISEKEDWTKTWTHPSLRGTGVAAFAFRIHCLLGPWEQHWSRLIDALGEALTNTVDLNTILSPEGRRRVMIDRSDLQLSEFYFAIIQTLRIAADWIQESMDDLQTTVADMERLYFSPEDTTPAADLATFLPPSQAPRDIEIQVFKKNWDTVLSRQRMIGDALLARIFKKQEEIKSLRDGLFNATSVNEATKSTQLNNAILVLTIVTIFYLPLSFVVALYSLDFFDLKGDSGQTKWFIVTTVLVVLATYFVSGVMIVIVQDPSRVARVFDRLVVNTGVGARAGRSQPGGVLGN